MKILFLDFDGVILLLPADGHFEAELEPSADAVSNLNLLVQVTGAEVVVASTWRIGRTVDELQALLRSWGYKWSVFGKIEDSIGEEDRGTLIERWLNFINETIDAFVVIDDERTDLEHFARQLVSPKPDVGLQLHDVAEAVRILDAI